MDKIINSKESAGGLWGRGSRLNRENLPVPGEFPGNMQLSLLPMSSSLSSTLFMLSLLLAVEFSTGSHSVKEGRSVIVIIAYCLALVMIVVVVVGVGVHR